MAAAYASLLSLGHILDQLLQHPPRQMAVLHKAQIHSLLQIITFLQDFLEEYSLTSWVEIQALEEKISRSAYAAEDIIESRVVDQILAISKAQRRGIFTHFNLFSKKTLRSSTEFSQDLDKVIEEFDSMKKDVMKIKEIQGKKVVQQPTKDATSGSFVRGTSRSKNTMVGFDEDLIQLMEMLTGDESNLQILPLVGMGGIGKTTLAKNVFDNPLIVQHFDRRALVTISQQYSVHEILVGLLKNIGFLAGGDEEITRDDDDDELGLRMHRSLFDRRYFIVMDDMWTIEVWDGIKRFFPDNNNGSRVMVTTRLTNVADDFRSCAPHQLHFLDGDQSWALFCDKVFGKESCPPELEEAGKTIVRNCRGLPLAIVAIGGLLAKSSRTFEYWDYVANDTYAALNMGGDEICFDILSLSYKFLPIHLKPCFLYLSIFPEDCEIRISRLVKLWVAEGILKPMGSRNLEEIAEENLKDLIDRNLIQVNDYGSRKKIKTCTIHDLLRDLCLREARKEKFLCVSMIHSLNSHPRSINNQRRLIIQRSSDEEELQQQVFDAMNSVSSTRSLICCELKSTSIKLSVCFRLLRVLCINGIYSCKEIQQLVNSRYIDFKAPSYPNMSNTLESLSLLWNLQTITIGGSASAWPMNLPGEIWEMPQLRHLEMEGEFHLPDPPSKKGRRDIIVLKNLQTLYQISNFSCTDEVVHRIPNLRKLGTTYLGEFTRDYGENVYNISKLHNLESLVLDSYVNVVQIRLPQSLKKLTLERCRVCWEDLKVAGSLPHLEVLNLRYNSVLGPCEWNPVEGEFLELKCLRIDDTELVEWTADSFHFPRLEKLQLGFLRRLKEIPFGIGEIQTLRSISLAVCSESANSSAQKIQEEQRNLGNYDLQLRILKRGGGEFSHTVV
ncbi:putative late blight resistance protein homolog R1A-3 [Henckelia pumila]|uniref:putative late blight resistance protein homolog R1A-3 n=1 Tax=Henckelia pumila TaxID=405737 RepID=UPI003C6DFEF0